MQVSAQRQILAGLIVDLFQLADGRTLGPLTPDAIAELHLNNEEEHVVPIIDEPPIVAQDQQPTEGRSVATIEHLRQQGAELVRNGHVSKGKYAMKLDGAHSFIENCGCFVMERQIGRAHV